MKMRWWVAVCVAALVATFNCSIAYAQDRDEHEKHEQEHHEHHSNRSRMGLGSV